MNGYRNKTREERSWSTHLLSIDKKEKTGRFRGSRGETYTTSLRTCTCYDFRKRRLTCKHIYRLKRELENLEPVIPIVPEQKSALTFDSTIRPMVTGSIFNVVPHAEILSESASQDPKFLNPQKENDPIGKTKRKSIGDSVIDFIKVAAIFVFIACGVISLANENKSSRGCSHGGSYRSSSPTGTKYQISNDHRPQQSFPANDQDAIRRQRQQTAEIKKHPETIHLMPKLNLAPKTPNIQNYVLRDIQPFSISIPTLPEQNNTDSKTSYHLSTAITNRATALPINLGRELLDDLIPLEPSANKSQDQYAETPIFPDIRLTDKYRTVSLDDQEISEWQGECIGISDGDTITVLNNNKQQIKIRLYGIDCPESGQEFGNMAKKYIGDFVFRKHVVITPVETDRYGRIVAHVEVNRISLNRALIDAGLAWVYTQYCKTDECTEWSAIQAQAKLEKRGLWAQQNPTPPWEFRNSSKENTAKLASNVTSYHGNKKSNVFHRPSCRHFNCKNCTANFSTRESAISAGYRPCGICRP